MFTSVILVAELLSVWWPSVLTCRATVPGSRSLQKLNTLSVSIMKMLVKVVSISGPRRTVVRPRLVSLVTMLMTANMTVAVSMQISDS